MLTSPTSSLATKAKPTWSSRWRPRWRLRRVWDIETALIDLEIRANAKSFESQVPKEPEHLRVAHAWKSLAAEASALTLLNRYETRIQTSYNRALRNLQMLRSGKVDAPNEPEPVDGVTEAKPKFEPILVAPHPSPTPEQQTQPSPSPETPPEPSA